MNPKIALFPGSFDPFTNGHHDIVMRSLSLFDQLIISVGYNTQKSRYFDLDKMTENIKLIYKNEPKISVVVYNELTSEFAKKHDAKYLIRGLRNTTDFEYENTIAQVNHHINSEIETIFLITDPKFAYISSSIVRELHKFGKNINDFLPYQW